MGKGEETIGRRIRRLRMERGLSQRELAAPGVSAAYISRLENDERAPSMKTLRLLAPKLGVTPSYLETGRTRDPAEERDWRLSEAELELRVGDDMEAAEREFRVLLGEAKAAGDDTAAVRARIGLGRAASHRGAHAEAIEQLEAAIAHASVTPATHPDVYATLARAYVTLGPDERAVMLLEQCLEEIERDHPEDRTAYVRFATYLSYALSDLGDLSRARGVLDEVLARHLDDEVDAYTQARLYWSQARLASMQEHYAVAQANIGRAIALLEASEDTYYLARAHALYGESLLWDGLLDQARRRFQVAEQLFGARAETKDRAGLLVLRAELAARAEDARETVVLAERALGVVGSDDPDLSGRAEAARGEGLFRLGDVPRALAAFARAEPLLRESHPRYLRRLYEQWSGALEQAGQLVEALEILRRAAALSAVAVRS